MWIFPIELLFFFHPLPSSLPPHLNPPRTLADCYAPRLQRLLTLRIDDLWKCGSSNTHTTSDFRQFLERPFAPISNDNLIRSARLLHRSVVSFQVVKLSSNLCFLPLFTYWRGTRESLLKLGIFYWVRWIQRTCPNNIFEIHFRKKNCMNSSPILNTINTHI